MFLFSDRTNSNKFRVPQGRQWVDNSVYCCVWQLAPDKITDSRRSNNEPDLSHKKELQEWLSCALIERQSNDRQGSRSRHDLQVIPPNNGTVRRWGHSGEGSLRGLGLSFSGLLHSLRVKSSQFPGKLQNLCRFLYSTRILPFFKIHNLPGFKDPETELEQFIPHQKIGYERRWSISCV